MLVELLRNKTETLQSKSARSWAVLLGREDKEKEDREKGRGEERRRGEIERDGYRFNCQVAYNLLLTSIYDIEHWPRLDWK